MSQTNKRCEFPPTFVWGAATSAYQIEGATQAAGRGESIWDRFCATPGKIQDGSSGAHACDHYARFLEDIDLMRQLKLRAYRFSISWPRIQPQGRGAVNARGLDFYERLVDALLAADIEPYVTLYHWDLPQALEDAGGWCVRDTAQAFADYARTVGARLGTRVRHWITHNEPWCASMMGYCEGRHAPGATSWPDALRASHHLLLSHGWAAQALRDTSPNAAVGIALNLTPAHPASPSAADHDAARHFDGYFNRWFLDPIYGRGFPEDMLRDYAALGRLPDDWSKIVQPGDLTTIAEPLDFLGVNYYNRAILRSERIPDSNNLPRTTHAAPASEWTEMGWEVYPPGLCEILARVQREYAPRKVFVTENGASYGDAPDVNGRIRDEKRVRFLHQHLASAHQALQAGVPLAGYFLWSLLDNFEWGHGYQQRFGMVWVDFATQQRLLKDSAHWYRGVIEQNALPSDL